MIEISCSADLPPKIRATVCLDIAITTDCERRWSGFEVLVFDADAAVLHDVESGVSGFFRRGFVGDAELHPDHLRADGDSLIDDRWHILRLAEYIDNFDQFALFRRNGGERRPAFEAEHFVNHRIDRIDGVARMDQVASHGIARPLRLVRNADNGDVFVFREYRCDVHRGRGEALHQSCWQRAVPDEPTRKYRSATRLTTGCGEICGRMGWIIFA